MTFRGVVRNGKVELEPGSDLPEGSSVDVNLNPSARRKKPGQNGRAVDPAFRISDLAVDFGRRDGSLEHDHYLYGTPKRFSPSKKPAAPKRKSKARSRR